MMDLSTTYLGMRLPHPLIVGAGPLSDDLDTVRALEDAGAALLVLRSLYEEEITGEQMDAFLSAESHNDSFAEAGTYAPDPIAALGPNEYLEHLRLVKAAVRIPVMASLNCVTPGGWTSYARQLDAAGADGLVLFTRFHRVDIDVDELEVIRTLPLSDSSELPLRLRGTAAVAGRVKASLAITGGIHTGVDVIKATMAGADATQMVSALLRHGPKYLRTVREDIESWMQEREWNSLNEMRGNMSFGRIPDPTAYERAN